MNELFLKIINMSITASWLVLAVIAVRLVFQKTPKWILCLFWGLVAVRLICPFSIESRLSLIPDTEQLLQDVAYSAETVKQARGRTDGIAGECGQEAAQTSLSFCCLGIHFRASSDAARAS